MGAERQYASSVYAAWPRIVDRLRWKNGSVFIGVSNYGQLTSVKDRTVTVAFASDILREWAFGENSRQTVVLARAIADELGGEWEVEAVVDPSVF